MKLQKRNGTYWLQADRRVTVEDKTSANALAGFSSVKMAPIQESGAASSSGVAVAEPFPNAAQAGTVSQEAVPIEQGQPLRAVEPDEWACVSGKAADDPHRRRQDAKYSGLDVASFDRCDISEEVGMFNKKLKFKVLGSHRSGAVAALEHPKDVAEHRVRFVCDMLETWGFGVCVLKCQTEPAERALQNAVVRTRQFKTIPRTRQVFAWQFGSL